MKKLFVIFLLPIFSSVLAMPIGYIGNIGEKGSASLLLHNTPCTNEKAMEKVKEEFRKEFFHGEYTFKDGHQIIACWAVKGNIIYIVDEEGDLGSLPTTMVKPLTKL